MPDKTRATFSMQVPTELLARIDANALANAGGNRTQYILSWLPETYEPATPASQTKAEQPNKRQR